ncbi:hypothetical protein AM202_02790 [Actinobacillus minor 202]|uniref:Uncharacterized protein n=1 Tax=Actinobacillus minor 202 TaxID=591023 RepID=A0ABP2GT90_9PAST|nr:hypothetical protein AM202_02790 [Actinobacillus minor 202]
MKRFASGGYFLEKFLDKKTTFFIILFSKMNVKGVE